MDIRDARYVSLTTYKRDGDPVHVPVWIAPLDDGRAGFTTDVSSYKVKRVLRDPRVVLRPCDMRGKVPDDAVEVTGTAVVETEGPDQVAVARAIGKKYGIQYTLLEVGGKLKRMVSRDSEPPAAFVITLDA